MPGRWNRRVGANVIVIGLSWLTGVAEAQVGLPLAPGAGASSPAAMMANPYLNPALNPYLNPAATQRPIDGRDAALYLYMANSANGGLGSGRLSGTRPGPGGMVGPKAQPARPRGGTTINSSRGRGRGQRQAPVAEMPDSASVPGSSAARFFNPGPVNTNGAGRYFARPNTYFNSNGH